MRSYRELLLLLPPPRYTTLASCPTIRPGVPANAAEGATERDRRRYAQGGEKVRRRGWSGRERSLVCARLLTATEILPRGTRHHVAPRPNTGDPPLPISRWTMGRPTIERIGVMERCRVHTTLADPRRAGEEQRAARGVCLVLALRAPACLGMPLCMPLSSRERGVSWEYNGC